MVMIMIMMIMMIAKAAVGLKLLKLSGLLFPLARVIKAFLLVGYGGGSQGAAAILSQTSPF